MDGQFWGEVIWRAAKPLIGCGMLFGIALGAAVALAIVWLLG